MIVIIRPLPELLVCFSSGLQSWRHPFDIGCDALVVGHAASAGTKSVRRRIHEVLAIRPIVRIIQHVAAHSRRRVGT